MSARYVALCPDLDKALAKLMGRWLLVSADLRDTRQWPKDEPRPSNQETDTCARFGLCNWVNRFGQSRELNQRFAQHIRHYFPDLNPETPFNANFERYIEEADDRLCFDNSKRIAFAIVIYRTYLHAAD